MGMHIRALRIRIRLLIGDTQGTESGQNTSNIAMCYAISTGTGRACACGSPRRGSWEITHFFSPPAQPPLALLATLYTAISVLETGTQMQPAQSGGRSTWTWLPRDSGPVIVYCCLFWKAPSGPCRSRHDLPHQVFRTNSYKLKFLQARALPGRQVDQPEVLWLISPCFSCSRIRVQHS
jgi:hypothetical protein